MKSETVLGRNGSVTVRIEGKYLHSAYSPEREATRAADAFSLDAYTRVLIVIGEGVPYFSRTLLGRIPNLNILSILIGPGESQLNERNSRFQSMSLPEPTVDEVRRTLRQRLGLLDAVRVQAYIWPPAKECAGDWVQTVQTGALSAIQDLHAELATTASFGRLWLKNALRRSLLSDTRGVLSHSASHTSKKGVILVGGGPTALSGIDAIHGLRRRNSLLAVVSSAVTAVIGGGYTPDVIFHTDAGFWAKRYRKRCTSEGKDIPTVVTLRASAPPGGYGQTGTEILFRHGWIGEHLAPDMEEWQFVPEFPTVSGTMLAYISRAVPALPITLTGFDLCSYDVITHGRPHPNDSYTDLRANRLNPELTMRALRSGYLTEERRFRWVDGTAAFQNGALSAFSEPLRFLFQRVARERPIIHQIPSPIWADLPPGPRIDEETHVPVAGDGPGIVVRTRPPRSYRYRHAGTVIHRWFEELDAPDNDKKAGILLLHLAPVETLAALRAEAPRADAVDTARRVLRSFLRMVEDGQ